MNPRICTVKHNPPHSYADCIRACIATLLDRDDVPHVFDGRPAPDSWSELRAWLKSINRTLFLVDVGDPWEYMELNNPGVAFMLLCSTGSGDHAVICRNGKVVHDPAWYKTEIKGPHSVGVWIVGVIGIMT